MPLLVVPLAPEETGRLTLAEWDALVRCERVLFERPDHPLAARLAAAGIAAGPFDDEPGADREGWALVTDPDSQRVAELADRGADVSSGSASPPDAPSAARGAYLARRAAASVATLVTVMARLRRPGGCPWDAEQTHESLQVHLLEETYEVIEAIETGAQGAELEEELGDVLLQVAFHAEMAAEDGRFDLASIAERLTEKLVRRHPHVFAETAVADAGEVVRNWEAIKQREKGSKSPDDPFEGLPPGLPALLKTYKVQKRAAALGFEADADEAAAKLDELIDGAPESSVGELLFWTVALARACGVDPEAALRGATRRFTESLTRP